MTSQVFIDRLEAHEWERLRDIRLRALREAADAFGSTYDQKINQPESVWVEQALELPTWIAVTEANKGSTNKDVGMVRAVASSNDPASAYLISMWVAPEVRGRGAGGQLVESVLDWATEVGFERVILDVGDHNSAAIRLYEKHGFEPTGATATLPPPRHHISEHERVRELGVHES